MRDPRWIYAYWELPAVSGRLVLRLYEVERSGGTLRFSSDTALDDNVSDRYLQVDDAGREWLVEIGRFSSGGKFLPLARSNAVRTPPEAPIPASAGGIVLGAWHSPGSLWKR